MPTSPLPTSQPKIPQHLAPDRPASFSCCVLSLSEWLDTTTAGHLPTPKIQNLPGQSLLQVPYPLLRHLYHPLRWIRVKAFGKPLDVETADMWTQRFEETFRQRTALEWQESINAAGGACTVCKTVEEWLDHPHPLDAKMVEEVEDAVLGRMKQPGVQVRLRGTPGAIQGRAPLLGEHTEEVLKELDTKSAGTVSASPKSVNGQDGKILSPLQGVRVLDLCIVLAGPTCGRTLAEYGADVIKIDDPSRPYDPSGSLDVNRGKRSILLDLKKEEGRQVFFELLETADVVVENYRKGSLAKLGLDYESLRQRKPNLIYASLNAYGYDGPWSERPGWEQLNRSQGEMRRRMG